MSANPTENGNREIRPLTYEEIQESGFTFTDPLWEIAWQLRQSAPDSGSYYLASELRKFRGELQLLADKFTQAMERATAPWYRRFWWFLRERTQTKLMAEIEEADRKKREEYFEHVRQQAEHGIKHRFSGRY